MIVIDETSVETVVEETCENCTHETHCDMCNEFIDGCFLFREKGA